METWRRDRQTKLLLSEPWSVCDQLRASGHLDASAAASASVVDEDLMRPVSLFRIHFSLANVRFHAERPIAAFHLRSHAKGANGPRRRSTIAPICRWLDTMRTLRFATVTQCPWFEGGASRRRRRRVCRVSTVWARFLQLHLPFRVEALLSSIPTRIMDFSGPLTLPYTPLLFVTLTLSGKISELSVKVLSRRDKYLTIINF